MKSFTHKKEADVVVQGHMEKIAVFLQKKLGADLAALVLAGSFGRGEGSVFIRSDGIVEPLNDYDFLLVIKGRTSLPKRDILTKWERQCASLTGMRWIDFSVTSEDQLEKLSLTQANYDLRWGGQVIFGNTDVLKRIPAFDATDLPLIEAQILLTTRMWCFIGVQPDALWKDALRKEGRIFAVRQLSKALIAVGDSLLMKKGRYCVTYAGKAECIKEIDRLPVANQNLIGWGYEYKLGRTKDIPEGLTLRQLYQQALCLHLAVWSDIEKRIPVLKRLLFVRLFGSIKQLVRRQSFSGMRGVLLDRIQLRFLSFLRDWDLESRVGLILLLLLWVHCGKWISDVPQYAKKVANLRVGL